MRPERRSGSDLDFSLNVLIRALQLENIKRDTVLEIWGRDISHICHRPLGNILHLEERSHTLANIFALLDDLKSSGNEMLLLPRRCCAFLPSYIKHFLRRSKNPVAFCNARLSRCSAGHAHSSIKPHRSRREKEKRNAELAPMLCFLSLFSLSYTN